MISTRLKILAAAGVLIGGIGVAAVQGAFASPSLEAVTPNVAAAVGTVTPTGQTKPRPSAFRGPGVTLGQPLADYLGISVQDLQTAIKSGQTLAQVGSAHSKSVSDLKTFFTNQLKTRLDQAVASGKMTSDQETAALANESSRLDTLINNPIPQRRPLGPNGGPRGGILGSFIQPVAGFLGITPQDLQTALRNGQTLAQIAQANGKSASDLKAFLLTQASTQIDKLLTSSFQGTGQPGPTGQTGPRGRFPGGPKPTAPPPTAAAGG